MHTLCERQITHSTVQITTRGHQGLETRTYLDNYTSEKTVHFLLLLELRQISTNFNKFR